MICCDVTWSFLEVDVELVTGLIGIVYLVVIEVVVGLLVVFLMGLVVVKVVVGLDLDVVVN